MTQAERLAEYRRKASPMADVLLHIQYVKGDKGDKGDDGEQGPKGEAGVGIDGTDGKDGAVGERGPAGRNGVDGLNGKSGKDGRNGKDGTAPAPQTIIDAVLRELAAGKFIKPEHVEGLGENIKSVKELVKFLKAGGFRGGGMSLVSGSNVTIVQNPNGTYTISASGGGSSNLTTEKVVAVQVVDNATIDLTQLAHTFTSILFVTLEGAVLLPNGSAAIPTPSWSRTGNTITVYNANAAGAFLVQYTY